MQLLWAELRDFRNHRETRVEAPNGLITAVGANGEGKTNLLEGIFYLLTLSSPRVSSDEPLVRKGAEFGYVRGEVQTRDGRILIEVEVRRSGANRVQVNRSPVRRKRDLRRQVRAAFFEPDDIRIILGDPSRRRGFMDEALVALWPLRETTLTNYEKALRQRNRLLKDWGGSGAPSGLDAWDDQVIEEGSAVIRARTAAVQALQGPATKVFEGLSGYGLEVTYQPSVVASGALEDAFRSQLLARRGDELMRRTTLVGPHRDDLALAVRDLGARGFASHGESWGAALSLRLGLATALESEAGETPITLLDDPFSPLDPARRDRAASDLVGRGQVLVSVADEGDIPTNTDEVWDVAQGTVTPRAGAA